jgi:hypothetical protein
LVNDLIVHLIDVIWLHPDEPGAATYTVLLSLVVLVLVMPPRLSRWHLRRQGRVDAEAPALLFSRDTWRRG